MPTTYFKKQQGELLAGSKILWPQAEPYEHLMKVIVNERQASFQSEKQNDPYDPERQIFDMNQAKRFKLEYNPVGEITQLRWCDGSNRCVSASQIYQVIAFHDPALCEGKEADYAAIVVCASDLNGYIYCLDAYIEKVSPSRQIEQAFALQKKWNIDVLYLEENNFQGILKDHYRLMQSNDSSLRIKGVVQHHNKVKRIASLEPLVTNGQLLFNVDLNPRLISQMQLFPTSHDDGPDALHGAVEPFRKRLRFSKPQ